MVQKNIRIGIRAWTKYYPLAATMSKQYNVRWAFNVLSWKPTEDDVLAASSFIQKEEKERISKFVFQKDAATSLIGRLMLRKYIYESTGIPYETIRLGRDGLGKPVLLFNPTVNTYFNVSHQGDFVVLAGSTEYKIGVDIMKIEPPVNKDIPEFFRIMKRQLSPPEWSTIRNFTTEFEQIACFYRIWCLKESYVKNIGLGLQVNLEELTFNLKTPKLKMGEVINDSTLIDKNELKSGWIFEESLIDEKHTAAVALEVNSKHVEAIPFTLLNYEDLVAESKPVTQADPSFVSRFMKKKLRDL